jgi:hypothetical protein
MRRALAIALSALGLMASAGVAYADPPNQGPNNHTPDPNQHAVDAVCNSDLPEQASDVARDHVPFC